MPTETEANTVAAIVSAVTADAPASPFNGNANLPEARSAAAKASLAKPTVAKRAVSTKRANKPVAKPATKRVVAIKPTKPSKPAANDRSAIIAAGRKLVATVYHGLSPVVRATAKLIATSEYDQRYASPIQRTDLAHVSPRDNSNLVLMLGARTAGFDPAALNIDRGAFSRLCSVGFIKRGDKAGTYALTPVGAAHARKAKAAVAA